jgi:hypothetical protein
VDKTVLSKRDAGQHPEVGVPYFPGPGDPFKKIDKGVDGGGGQKENQYGAEDHEKGNRPLGGNGDTRAFFPQDQCLLRGNRRGLRRGSPAAGRPGLLGPRKRKGEQTKNRPQDKPEQTREDMGLANKQEFLQFFPSQVETELVPDYNKIAGSGIATPAKPLYAIGS